MGLLSHTGHPDHLRALALELSLHADSSASTTRIHNLYPTMPRSPFFFSDIASIVSLAQSLKDIVGLVKLSDLTFDARVMPLDY